MPQFKTIKYRSGSFKAKRRPGSKIIFQKRALGKPFQKSMGALARLEEPWMKWRSLIRA